MYLLTFRVRHYAVMCSASVSSCQYVWSYVVIATKPVHQLQIRPVVHKSYIWVRADRHTDTHRRTWPLYISRRLQLIRTV